MLIQKSTRSFAQTDSKSVVQASVLWSSGEMHPLFFWLPHHDNRLETPAVTPLTLLFRIDSAASANEAASTAREAR